MIHKYAEDIVASCFEMDHGDEIFSYEKLADSVKVLTAERLVLDKDKYMSGKQADVVEQLYSDLIAFITNNFKDVPAEVINSFYHRALISIIDKNWTDHIDDMDKLRKAIGYMGMANMNPLNEYINRGFEMFQEMMKRIAETLVNNVMRVEFRRVEIPVGQAQQNKPKKRLAL